VTRSRHRLSVAVVVLAALLAFAATPSAHAAWTDPITIATGVSFPDERVAFDPNGNAIFAYEAYDSACGCQRIQTRVLYANGTLSAPQYVSPTGGSASYPSLAVDQAGNAAYVWSRRDGSGGCGVSAGCDRVQIRVRFANGSMSATKTLSDPGQNAWYPEVAVDPNGNATAVWFLLAFHEPIQARRRSASGTLGPLLTISDPTKNNFAERPHVAVDRSGNAIFAFNQQDGSSASGCLADGCKRVQTRVLSAGGSLSAIQILSPPGRSAGNGQLGVDQNGNAIFMWSRQDGTTDCHGTGCDRVQTRVRRSDGTLSVVQTLSDPGQDSYGTLAVNQLGTAAFVWLRKTASTRCSYGAPCLEVQTRVRRAGGALSAVQAITSAKPDAGAAHVGIDQNGNAVYVWIAAASAPTNLLRARTRSSSGTLSTPKTLANSGEGLYDTALAVSPNGRAIAAWYPYLSGRLEAAVGP
jgi:hypothetical protein